MTFGIKTILRWPMVLGIALCLASCGGGGDELSVKGSLPSTIGFGVDSVNRDDLLAHRRDQTTRLRLTKLTDGPSSYKFSVPAPTLAEQKKLVPEVGTRARQIGVPLSVPNVRSATEGVLIPWRLDSLGGMTGSLQFTSTGAKGLRLGVLVSKLPDQAVVRVFGPTDDSEHVYSGQQINRLLALNRSKDGASKASSTWWTPYVDGDSLIVAFDLPKGIPAQELQLTTPELTYFVESPRAAASRDSVRLSAGASGACHVNASCYPDWSNERKATAHMVFQSGGSGYVCTGTLLNDSESSGTPYFVTAYHCISTQSEASSLQTHWFAEASSCGSSALSSAYTVRTGGAELLRANEATDTSFMRLNTAPPSGVTFSGWHVGVPSTGWSVTGVHHPSGDLKKISFGAVESFTDCTTGASGGFSCSTSSTSVGRFIGVRWQQGVTEGGSSGSSLWAMPPGASTPRVVGQLYGGGSSCEDPTGLDHYGRFDLAYESGLKNWLGSGVTTPTPSPAPVPAPTPSGGSSPENGWWWNAAESGRGFAIEQQGNRIYLAGFMYTTGGRDVWYSGAFTQTSTGRYTGELREYAGGNDRVMTSVLKGPNVSSQVATAELTFSTSRVGNLRVDSAGATQNIALTRFPFGGFNPSNAAFESGWWWNPNDSGHGYFLETQGSSFFGAAYTYYTSSGVAGWYTIQGALQSSSSFQNSTVSWFRSGQSLLGAYKAPEGPFNPATATFVATSATTGILTFRSDTETVVVNLQRFVY